MGCANLQKAKELSMRKQQATEPQMPSQEIKPLSISQQNVAKNGACGYKFLSNVAQPSQNQQITTNHNNNISNLQRATDQFDVFIDKCTYYYQQHDIDTAYQYVTMMENLKQKFKSDPEINTNLQSQMETNSQLINQVKEEYNDVIKYQKEITKGQWILKSDHKGIKISTRRQNTTVSCLVQSIVNQSFEVLITALIEMDLYKEFMPFMTVSRQEKIVARNCRIGYTQNDFPILSIRQAFFQGIGYTRLHKTKRLFLYTRSIHNRPDLQQRLGYQCKINADYVQLEYKFFVLQYEPICKGKGKIIMAMNVDTKMDFIPMWIQDKIAQDFGHDFFKNIVNISKKFHNSQWEKNTQANPDLFLFFKNAIDKHLEKEDNK